MNEIQKAIEWAISPACYSELATDIAKKSARFVLSPRQQEVLLKIHAGFTARQAAKQARLDAGIVSPSGRATVSGILTKVVQEESAYGVVTKVHLDLSTGAKTRGNTPRDSVPVVGQEVSFTATFTPSQHDSSSGYFSRAVKWTTIKAASAMVA